MDDTTGCYINMKEYHILENDNVVDAKELLSLENKFYQAKTMLNLTLIKSTSRIQTLKSMLLTLWICIDNFIHSKKHACNSFSSIVL